MISGMHISMLCLQQGFALLNVLKNSILINLEMLNLSRKAAPYIPSAKQENITCTSNTSPTPSRQG